MSTLDDGLPNVDFTRFRGRLFDVVVNGRVVSFGRLDLVTLDNGAEVWALEYAAFTGEISDTNRGHAGTRRIHRLTETKWAAHWDNACGWVDARGRMCAVRPCRFKRQKASES